MSRANRRHGDVLSYDDVVPIPPLPYPTLYDFPPGYPRGTGRLASLDCMLLREYRHMFCVGNSSHFRYYRCPYSVYPRMNPAIGEDDKGPPLNDEFKTASVRAISIVGEIEALGYHALIPRELKAHVHSPGVAPSGSMSYLEKFPHYFPFDKYAPHGSEEPISVANVKDANRRLLLRFDDVARCLNHARFLRDWRIRCGVNASAILEHNHLNDWLDSARYAFVTCLELFKMYKDSDGLLAMPDDLRQFALSDCWFKLLLEQEDLSLLYPRQQVPTPPSDPLYLVYVSAVGFALFEAYGFDVHLHKLDEAQSSTRTVEAFKKVVRLIVYFPCSPKSEPATPGHLSPTLKSFLQVNLPSCNDMRCVLGISDPDLGRCIWKELRINYFSKDSVDELLNGIRRYFGYFVSTEEVHLAATLNPETLVILALTDIVNLNQLIHSTIVHITEWNSLYFPELRVLVADDHLYCKIGYFFLSTQSVDIDALSSLTQDKCLAKTVVAAKKSSIGFELDQTDLEMLKRSISVLIKMFESRECMQRFIEAKMREVAPNLSSLLGGLSAAHLIMHAGCLDILADYPSSNIEMVGANQKPSRDLPDAEDRIMWNSSFVVRATDKNKEEVARHLALKCKLAAKVDGRLAASDSRLEGGLHGQRFRQEMEEL